MSKPGYRTSLQSLRNFWDRHPFHDMPIERVDAINRRVLIPLSEYSLIVTQVSRFTRHVDEFPTVWLYESIAESNDTFQLKVEIEGGSLSLTGRDVRLIRNVDLAVLIPPVDVGS